MTSVVPSLRPLRLTAVEGRVLGCLVEKQYATPDQYPLTVNALVAACNQTTSRDPIVSYDAGQVTTALLTLREKGLARMVHGGRAVRHQQLLAEALGLGRAEQAVLALLLLRGPQTGAELRARSERLHAFASLAGVEESVDALAARTPPLVARLDRQSGQKEGRVTQCVVDGPGESAPDVTPAVASEASPATGDSRPDDIAALRREVAELRDEIAALRAEIRRS